MCQNLDKKNEKESETGKRTSSRVTKNVFKNVDLNKSRKKIPKRDNILISSSEEEDYDNDDDDDTSDNSDLSDTDSSDDTESYDSDDSNDIDDSDNSDSDISDSSDSDSDISDSSDFFDQAMQMFPLTSLFFMPAFEVLLISSYGHEVIRYLNTLHRNPSANESVQNSIDTFLRVMNDVEVRDIPEYCMIFRDQLRNRTGWPLGGFPTPNEALSQLIEIRRSIIENDFNREPIGLSDQEISRLKTQKFLNRTRKEKISIDDDPKCPICLTEYENGDELIPLQSCKHKFHSNCIKSWLKKSKQCPICRSDAIKK